MWRSTLLLLAMITLTVFGLRWLVLTGSVLPPQDQSIHVTQAEFSLPGQAVSAVQLPHDWRDHPAADDARQGVYRFAVDLQVPPNRLWGVLLPKVEQNAVVSLNGEEIGTLGRLTPYPTRHINQSVYFVIPNGVLLPGRNEFALAVHTFPPGQGFLDTVVLAPDAVLQPFHQRLTFVKRDLVWFFSAISLAMTLMIGVLALQRREQPVYLWFTCVCGLWTAQSYLAMAPDPWLPLPVNMAVMSAIASWFCATTFFFALRFIGVSMPRFERIILLSAVLGTVMIAAGVLFVPEQTYRFAPLATMLQMAYGPVVAYQTVKRFIATRDPEVFLMLYAGGIIMALGAFSITVATGTSSGVRGHYLFYATPIVLGVFVLHLLRQFVLAVRESESLNHELEARVADKTLQLESNFARLNEMEKERAIAEERERLMRDMHDGVGGQLVSSIMRLKNGDQPAAVQSSLEQALTDLRMMIDSLESSNDLNTALGMLRSRLHQQLAAVGVAVSWHADEIPPEYSIDPHTTLQVMRIVQEAFANVLKHAQAQRIEFELRVQPPTLELQITDNGRGLSAANGDQGHGIRNMQHRAQSIGGTLTVADAQPGCRVALSLPLPG